MPKKEETETKKPKRTAGKVGHNVPIAAVHRIMKKAGAYRVSEPAATELSEYLEEKGVEITREAMELAKHAQRVTVHEDDIQLAVKKHRK